MGRPLEPLIDPNAVIAEALRMLDSQPGTELSIRKLALKLGVTSSSLYHHFKEKDEILDGVCRRVLAGIKLPKGDPPWQEMMLEMGRRYRDALLQHPNVIPIIQTREPLRYGMPVYDSYIRRLTEAGFTAPHALALTRVTEALAFGSAVLSTRRNKPGYEEVPEHLGYLRAALASKQHDDEAVFLLAFQSLIDSFENKKLIPEKKRTARK